MESWSDGISVPIRKDNQDLVLFPFLSPALSPLPLHPYLAHHRKATWENGEKAAICKPGRVLTRNWLC